MKLVIITDTHSFKMKLLQDLLDRVSFDGRNDRIDSITFYHKGAYDPIFLFHLRKLFPGVEMRYRNISIPVRPGKHPNWRRVIRDEIASEADAGFMLTAIISERFNMIYFNLVHCGIMNNLSVARSVSPTITGDINFTRVEPVGFYFSNTSYPVSSLNIYKD